jgi:arginine deiminase
VAKAWLLDRKIVPNEVGLGLVDDTRGFLDSLPPRKLAELLIGGTSTRDLPAEITSGYRALAREAIGVTEYLMPPLPNTLYTRDTTCWIYGGHTMNPLFWEARHDETLSMTAIYEFHPDSSARRSGGTIPKSLGGWPQSRAATCWCPATASSSSA